ncbi:glycoside hydrolase family 16 protein [Actinomadura craniellae]|nr:glycoside hydrolase family 16 protein [Actinomadura craniellae]
MTSGPIRIGAFALLAAVAGCASGDHTDRRPFDGPRSKSREGGVLVAPRPLAEAAPRTLGTLQPKAPVPARPAERRRPGFWGRPILVEDFSGRRLDSRAWAVYHSPDARVHPRTRHAVRVAGGALRISGGNFGGRDLSGGVASLIDQRYGRWQVRMRADRGGGYSAVALLWPERMGDPEHAEIDFAEIIDPARRTHGMFIHRGPDGATARRAVRADFTRWRTVTVDWLPGRVVIWLDGRRVWDYRGPLVPRRGRMGLALQNDVVCGPGSCRTGRTPREVTMHVDWVRIHRFPG